MPRDTFSNPKQEQEHNPDLPKNVNKLRLEPIAQYYMEKSYSYNQLLYEEIGYLKEEIGYLRHELIEQNAHSQFLSQKFKFLEEELVNLKAEIGIGNFSGIYSFKSLIEQWIENSDEKAEKYELFYGILKNIPPKNSRTPIKSLSNFFRCALYFSGKEIDFKHSNVNDKHTVKIRYPNSDHYLSRDTTRHDSYHLAKEKAATDAITQLHDDPEFLYRLIVWQAPAIFKEQCSTLYELFLHSPIGLQEKLSPGSPLFRDNAQNYYHPHESYTVRSGDLSNIIERSDNDYIPGNSQIVGNPLPMTFSFQGNPEYPCNDDDNRDYKRDHTYDGNNRRSKRPRTY